jgi:hypothetical protein
MMDKRYEILGDVPIEELGKRGVALLAQHQEDAWRKHRNIEIDSGGDEPNSRYRADKALGTMLYWRGIYDGVIMMRQLQLNVIYANIKS